MKLMPPPFFFSPAGGAAAAASGERATGRAKARAQNLRRASMDLSGGQPVDAPFTTSAAYALPPPPIPNAGPSMSQSSLFAGLARGFAEHCPACGKGRLFGRYLKVASPCAACGHDNAQYPSDDAPPYFTILIVGH